MMIDIKSKSPEKINYNLIMVTCQKCGAQWYPRKKTRPVRCARRFCLKWDTYKPKKKKEKQLEQK